MATSVLRHVLFNENGTQRYIYNVDSDVHGCCHFESLEQAFDYVKNMAIKTVDARLHDAKGDVEKYGHSQVDLTIP